MGTLVFSEDTDLKYKDIFGVQKRSTGIWWNEEKDSFSVITKDFVHRPRKSGAVSKYWQVADTSIYKKTKSGYCLCYHPVKGRMFSDRILSIDMIPSVLREAPGFEQWFKPCDIENTPLGSHFASRGSEDLRYQFRQSPITPYLYTSNTMPEFVAATFGKTRIRKDLVKAVAQSSFSSVECMWAARGIVPVDWIVTALREEGNLIAVQSKLALKGARWVLPRVRPQVQKTILSEMLRSDLAHRGYLRDIRWVVERDGYDIPPDLLMGRNIRNIRDAHDALIAFRRARKEFNTNVSVELTGFKKEMNDQQIGDMTFVIANTSQMLRDWGNIMSNCIGSYDAYLRSNDAILGGIYEGDTLIANTELQRSGGKWRVIQLLGKYNRPVADNHKKQVEKFFTDNNVDVSQYWGKN